MKFTITKNKKLDYDIIGQFLENKSQVILDSWPGLVRAEDIPKYVDEDYNDDMEKLIKDLRTEIPWLTDITEAISNVIGEPWQPIDNIYIYVGACPIAPRFLDINAFLLPYYYPIPTQINTATHELIHFLYFKKWAKLFPEQKPENFESPDPVWVLSEILVAVIGNDPRIQRLEVGTFDVYPNWSGFMIGEDKIMAPYEKIYAENTDFDTFLRKSWNKFQELDDKFQITATLVENPY